MGLLISAGWQIEERSAVCMVVASQNSAVSEARLAHIADIAA